MLSNTNQIKNEQLAAGIVTNELSARLFQCINSVSVVVREVWVAYNGQNYKEFDHIKIAHPNVHWVSLNWEGYARTKNQLAALMPTDWILSLDADEVLDSTLQTELSKIAFNHSNSVFKLKRQAFIGDTKIQFGIWGKDEVTRLYNKKIVQWRESDSVHETLCALNNEPFEVKSIKGTLNHYTAKTIEEVHQKHRKYATLFAQKLKAEKRRPPVFKKYSSALWAFVQAYIFCGGFLDGRLGFLLAKSIAQYSFWKYSS